MNDIGPQRLRLLRKQVITKFGLAVISIPVILFAIAGTLNYWQGWLYWVVLTVPMFLAVTHLLKHDPDLLERRMQYHEKEREQQAILKMGTVFFIAGFVAIAIDLRWHGLDAVPIAWILIADLGIFLGYLLILWVFKENSYASRTIEVAEGQKVITTGPYAIIRHPMYLGFLVMYLMTPTALGSWLAVPVFSLYAPIMVWRIIAEEKVLLKDLPGYYQYCLERRIACFHISGSNHCHLARAICSDA
jgi:protein-S-isoprenylcysteine O-methyltransferase Ste14